MTATAFIVQPVTDEMLVSTNIPEDEPLYDAATTYSIGDIVHDASHRKYESRQDNNLNNAPDPFADTQHWFRSGYTNRWEPFNYLTEYQCSYSSEIEYTIAPGRIVDAVYVGGMSNIRSLTITVRDSAVDGTIIKTVTKDLDRRRVVDFYSYFFADFVYENAHLEQDIPVTYNPYITIRAAGSGLISLASITAGLEVTFGKTKLDPVVDQTNFSSVERDFAGNLEIVKRRTAPIIDEQILINDHDVLPLIQFGKDANAEVCVWSAIDDFSHEYARPLLLMGVYEKFSFNLTHPKNAYLRIRVNGI